MYRNPEPCLELRLQTRPYTLVGVCTNHVALAITAKALAAKAGMQTAARLHVSITPGASDA